MSLEDGALIDALQSPPPGFEVSRRDDRLEIVYRRHGMRFLLGFLMVWLALWTCFLGFLISTTRLDASDIGWRIGVIPLCLLGEGVAAGYIAWMLFGVVSISLDDERLIVERRLGRWRKRTQVGRAAVSAVVQIKDGGDGSDSFPSWGLQVEAGETLDLLGRQLEEKSSWLGPVIAAWASKPFQPWIRSR
jgi:hypothetical protein